MSNDNTDNILDMSDEQFEVHLSELQAARNNLNRSTLRTAAERTDMYSYAAAEAVEVKLQLAKLDN